MGLWKIVKPEATTNLVLNPSFEENITDGWTSNGNGIPVRDTTVGYVGVASLRITADAVLTATMYSDSISVSNEETIIIQAQVLSDHVTAKITLRDVTNSADRATSAHSGGGEWEMLTASWTNETGVAASVQVYLQNDLKDGSTAIYFDAVQAEKKSYTTTYCDGTQPGCEWTGAAHNSTSTRDADAWQGGREYDLADDYGFEVQTVTGGDAPPVEVFGTPYAILPGEAADGERIAARDLFLMGTIYSDVSFADLQTQKAAFFDEFKHWRKGQTSRNSDPIKLRYEGTQRTLEIEVKYVGGYEGTSSWRDGFTQKFTLHFRAQEDVWWHTTNRQADVLDEEDSGTARYAMAKVDGLWTLMGPPAAGTSGTTIWSVVHDGISLYAGGDIVAFNNDADLDYFWKWNGSTWETVGSGSEGTGIVYDLALLPDGKVVIAGGFANWAADADYDYVITYDPTTDAYAAVGAGGPGSTATRVTVDPTSGDIAVVCDSGGVVKLWDGSSWSDITPADFYSIYDVFFGNDGTLWAAGRIDDGYPTVPYRPLLESYDGSTWTEELTGSTTTADEYINTGEVLSDGRVVIGGRFAEVGGVAVNNVAIYNGQTVDDMDDGITVAVGGFVARLFVDDDDAVYVSGDYSGAGGRDVNELAMFNGYTWMPMDLDPPGFPYALAFDDGDMYVGFDGSATAYYSGDTTITTTGGLPLAPRFKIRRVGGTSAAIRYLQNVDTDAELWFDIDVLDGETITIDIQARTITSDYGRKITGNPLPGSVGLGDFRMDASSNLINLWVDTVGAPTITATIDYWVNYDGYSGGDT